MKALVFDKSKYKWETSKGFQKVDVPKPDLDDDSVIIRVHYAGVCGTDRGIWYRQAFRDAILNSIDQESVIAIRQPAEKQSQNLDRHDPSGLAMIKEKSYRIIGHEFFGEVVEVGNKVKN